jgi:hypothetical protein
LDGRPSKRISGSNGTPKHSLSKSVLALFCPCGAIAQKRLDLMPNFESSQYTKIRALIFIKGGAERRKEKESAQNKFYPLIMKRSGLDNLPQWQPEPNVIKLLCP